MSNQARKFLISEDMGEKNKQQQKPSFASSSKELTQSLSEDMWPSFV